MQKQSPLHLHALHGAQESGFRHRVVGPIRGSLASLPDTAFPAEGVGFRGHSEEGHTDERWVGLRCIDNGIKAAFPHFILLPSDIGRVPGEEDVGGGKEAVTRF